MKADLLYAEFAPAALPAGGAPARGAPAGGGPSAGGPPLFAPDDALALISRAAEEGVPVVAVRGVRVAAGGAGSPPGPAADFSAAVAEGHGCWADAEAFVGARRGPGLAFAITLGDDPIEAV